MDIPVANFEVSMVFILRIRVVWVVSMSNRLLIIDVSEERR